MYACFCHTHFVIFTRYLSLDSVTLAAKFTCLGSTGIKLIPTTFTEITYCPGPGNLYDERTMPFGV